MVNKVRLLLKKKVILRKSLLCLCFLTNRSETSICYTQDIGLGIIFYVIGPKNAPFLCLLSSNIFPPKKRDVFHVFRSRPPVFSGFLRNDRSDRHKKKYTNTLCKDASKCIKASWRCCAYEKSYDQKTAFET